MKTTTNGAIAPSSPKRKTAQYQRHGTYHSGCYRHPGKMVPELARRIIAEFSGPGDLVVDPMCGIGTTLFEAALSGRRSVGVELEPKWAKLTGTNLDFALGVTQRRSVRIHCGDACNLVSILGRRSGQVDLICTSPPYGCDVGIIDKPAWDQGGSLCGGRNYSDDLSNLGHARGADYEDSMSEVYAQCFKALRPGGVLAVVTKNTRRRDRCFDLAALTIRLATGAGMRYESHVIALQAAVRDSALVGRPSFWQSDRTRKLRASGRPAHLVAHEDVTVFVKPESRPSTSLAINATTKESRNGK